MNVKAANKEVLRTGRAKIDHWDQVQNIVLISKYHSDQVRIIVLISKYHADQVQDIVLISKCHADQVRIIVLISKRHADQVPIIDRDHKKCAACPGETKGSQTIRKPIRKQIKYINGGKK